MLDATKALWAKKSRNNEPSGWLPLLTHLYDTGYTIDWLYQHWLSNNQRQLLRDIRLVRFIGFIHDWGKSTPAFQGELSSQLDTNETVNERLHAAGLNNTTLPEYYTASRHAVAGEVLLGSTKKLFCTDTNVPASVAAVVGGHHGMYSDASPLTGRWNNLAKYPENYWNDQKQWWLDVQGDILNAGLQFAGYNAISEIPEITQAQAALLSGLLVMADWLASSTSLSTSDGTVLFPLISLDANYDSVDETKRYQTAIRNWNLQTHWLPQKVESHYYESHWSFSPRPIQNAVANVINSITAPGIAIIEAPMGYGKTEIALAAAEQMAYKCGSTGIYFALPTQATANAMFTRVRDWMYQLKTSDKAPLDLKLMHGKARFNKSFQALKVNDRVTDNEWFIGKKSILDEFVVGTIDQVLMMALKQKHVVLKHLGLSDKVVVIDEVHSYDVFMYSYLTRALNWLGEYHVPVILLSATLPITKRQELMAAYTGGSLAGSSSTSYPLLTWSDGTQIHSRDYSALVTESTPVEVCQIDDNLDELALRIMTLTHSSDGVIGVIVSTVKSAQALAIKLKTEPILVLHASLLAPDRAERETRIQNLIGKNGKRPKKLIVIGTQILEQSLDIDFDVLFTDVAPMDMLLQRIGRLHRHAIARPEAFKIPKVYICTKIYSRMVYSPYILMRTRYYLPTKLNLPQDIVRLVNLVYADTELPIPGFDKAKKDFELAQRSSQSKAEIYRLSLPSPTPGKTLHGWLQFDSTENDSDVSSHVRDGAGSLEVVLLQNRGDALYTLKGTPIMQLSDREIAQQTINLSSWLVDPIDQTKAALERETASRVSNWQSSYWLKNSLLCVLDENLTGFINSDIVLHYDSVIGLTCIK